MHWPLQDAKDKLSRVVHEARTTGPQVITVHGKAAAVVLSAGAYRLLAGPVDSLVDVMSRSPWSEVQLEIER